MALLQNKPCQFYGHQKIYLQTKFELSKLILALSGPNFLFRPLNKLGPLVDYFKIAISSRAHTAKEKFSQVWLTSVNFKNNFYKSLCEPWITLYAVQCTSLAYVVRSPTLKRKSGCPTGIKKILRNMYLKFSWLIQTRENPGNQGVHKYDKFGEFMADDKYLYSK